MERGLIVRPHLVTTRILYHLPDFNSVLQEFVFQLEDYIPRYPKLRKFLGFWSTNIEGEIHSVEIAVGRLPAVRYADVSFMIH